MSHDITNLDRSEEDELECETVRAALVDALLRSRRGRSRRTERLVLSSLEELWVAEVARLLVIHVPHEPAPALRLGRGKRTVGMAADLVGRVLEGLCKGVPSDNTPAHEFHFVPVACGLRSDVRGLSDDGHIRESDAPSTARPPAKE